MNTLMLEAIKSMQTLIKTTDDVNRRLINCITVLSIVFGLTISIITACYFFSDYQTPTSIQEITKDKTLQKIGGDN